MRKATVNSRRSTTMTATTSTCGKNQLHDESASTSTKEVSDPPETWEAHDADDPWQPQEPDPLGTVSTQWNQANQGMDKRRKDIDMHVQHEHITRTTTPQGLNGERDSTARAQHRGVHTRCTANMRTLCSGRGGTGAQFRLLLVSLVPGARAEGRVPRILHAP